MVLESGDSCEECGGPAATTCDICGAAICEDCSIDGTCSICAEEELCVSRATARPPTSSTAMAAEGGFAGTATQRTGAGVRSGIPDQIYGRKQFVGKTLYEP
jgi:hypothetical protein